MAAWSCGRSAARFGLNQKSSARRSLSRLASTRRKAITLESTLEMRQLAVAARCRQAAGGSRFTLRAVPADYNGPTGRKPLCGRLR
jgi:hypothetical protein